MEAMTQWIRPELLVLVPVLHFAGRGLAQTPLPRRWASLALGAMGVGLALLYLLAEAPARSGAEAAMAGFAAVTQGILCAGCSALAGRLLRREQGPADEGEDEP